MTALFFIKFVFILKKDMSYFRSFFSKNNTLISSNLTNNSLNPVTEISFGTVNREVSRFIFDVDLQPLRNKINSGLINQRNIISHKIHLTNTIRYAPQYIGRKSYDSNINRASNFTLDFFNIPENWDEGAGYDFNYGNQYNNIEQAPNWTARTTGVRWNVDGIYVSGSSEIIGNQFFGAGNEDVDLDVTDYINQRLFGTGYTGTTIYSGNSYGLGIKFTDDLENLMTEYREAVAFHAKHTNTVFEPYLETIIDDRIIDDRNYFYLDKDNDLYFYSNVGNTPQNVNINRVEIFDYENNLVDTISGDSIIRVKRGVYKITLNISSLDYPDSVIFKDVWHINISGKNFQIPNDFYLISPIQYYSFNENNKIEFKNYQFYYWGINEGEKINNEEIRKIKLSIKEFYSNQNNNLPLEIEYRLFITTGSKYEIDVIPFTPVDRTSNGYEFDLDTSWLIPQDYYLQLRMKCGMYYENKEIISFKIVNNEIK